MNNPASDSFSLDQKCAVCGTCVQIVPNERGGQPYWLHSDGTNKDHAAAPVCPLAEFNSVSRVATESWPLGRFRVLTPGHFYELQNFEDDDSPTQTVQFIQKRAVDPSIAAGMMLTENNGTTNEAVLEVLIDRLNFLNSKFPCRENAVAITHLETALMWLEKRTRDRVKRGVEGLHKA